MTNATFSTEPFTCPSCIKKIEHAVGGLPGVDKVEVGFNSARVKVAFDEALQSADAIAKVITDLGYPVRKTAVA